MIKTICNIFFLIIVPAVVIGFCIYTEYQIYKQKKKYK